MKAEISRHRIVAAALSLWLLPALAACDSGPLEDNKAVLFPVTGPATPAPAMPSPTALPPPNATDLPAEHAPSAPMAVRKDFIDPPLPPELNDDGGLEPLPPRPVADNE